MTPEAISAGDRLARSIDEACIALMNNDLKAAWQAIDGPETAKALRTWNRARGREVPTEEEIEQGMATLLAAGREWLAQEDARQAREAAAHG